TAAHDIHRMSGCGDHLQRRFDRRRQSAQGVQLRLVRRELSLCRQATVDQQMRDFLELAFVGNIEDVIATVMEVVATAADRAEGGIPRRYTGERNRLLELVGRCFCHGRYSLKMPGLLPVPS